MGSFGLETRFEESEMAREVLEESVVEGEFIALDEVDAAGAAEHFPSRVLNDCVVETRLGRGGKIPVILRVSERLAEHFCGQRRVGDTDLE